ncbi:putative membrane protein YfcA [Bradyrhizobium sp. AZCC 2262]
MPAIYCSGRRWRAAAQQPSRHLTALIGFGGGLVGGLTAMPGAIPTIWCDMRGLPKSDQRGLVQPFIAIMQVLALALLLGRQSLSSKLVIDFVISVPALFAGSVLGIVAFRNINEVGFRRAILVLLLVSGASLALA